MNVNVPPAMDDGPAPLIVEDNIENVEDDADDVEHGEDAEFRVFRVEYPKPSTRILETVEMSGLPLVMENPHVNCHSQYEFNILNVRAYADNWAVLELEMQRTIKEFIDSDLTGNNLKVGMKRHGEFHQHLLLLTGCQIWNIRPYANTNMVLSNLRAPHGKYPMEKTKSRIIDARTCRQAAVTFNKLYDVSKLFREFDARIICFESDDSYRGVPEPNVISRSRYKQFFEKNAAILKAWARSKLIYSYIYSHEVSCDSILGMKFRPHTHAVVFTLKGRPAPDLQGRLGCTDRTLKIMETVHVAYDTLERFIPYMVGAYSLVPVYLREYTDAGVLELNKNTVQALHAIVELAGGARDEPGYKRFNSAYMPPRTEDEAPYEHPLLQQRNARARVR